jgi:hypothetical protein
LKNKLKDFQILGLRAAPKNMRGIGAAKLTPLDAPPPTLIEGKI